VKVKRATVPFTRYWSGGKSTAEEICCCCSYTNSWPRHNRLIISMCYSSAAHFQIWLFAGP